MKKAALRNIYKEKRNELSAAERNKYLKKKKKETPFLPKKEINWMIYY